MLWLATFFLGLVINLAPLALGSNRPLPWAYNAVLMSFALGLVWLAWMLNRDRHPKLHLALLAMPLALMGIVICWIGVQALPVGNLAITHPNWSFAEEVLKTDLAGRISVNPSETLAALMRLLTYFAVFLATFIAARDRALAGLLVTMFILSTCLYALYGLARISFDMERILWLQGYYTTSVLSSSFVGRNNAATYFGIGSVVAFAMLSHQIGTVLASGSGSSARYRFGLFLESLGGALGLYFLAFWLLFTAVLLTVSRGGIIATLLALGATFMLMQLRSGYQARKHRTPGLRLLAILALVALIVTAIEISGAHIIERLYSVGFDANIRASVYKDTLNAIRDHAWLGSGYGTFQDVFPLYRSVPAPDFLVFAKAHNDYLELFLGLGIPGALLFLFALFLILKRCLRGYFERRRDSVFPLIAIGATVLVFVHSFVDFSLQVEAISMCFAMLLGIGAAQSVSSRK
jgi:O-antigen ligase